MSLTTENLYALLPAILRQRDAERGEPLKALFDVLAREGRLFEEDLQRVHDNLFIETCDDWAVPYLGDLLGVRGLKDTRSTGFSARGRIANTLAYRRRKGTATMLEQLATDTTGWRARVVEFFELLGTTQWLNHLRLHSVATPDLRAGDPLELIGTAFESARHFTDVRRIAHVRGRYNLPNLGLFLWRLQSYHLAGVSAATVPDTGVADARGRFWIHPLGFDAPLFNRPRTETDISALAQEWHVPGRLRRRPLAQEIEALRLARAGGRSAGAVWFGADPILALAFRLTAGGAWVDVAREDLIIADLSDAPAAFTEVWLRPDPPATVADPVQVAVDPVLGRIAFPPGIVPAEVRISAAHAFPGDVGGGAYDRRESFVANAEGNAGLDRGDERAPFPLTEATWQAGVHRDLPTDPVARIFNSFADAVAQWNTDAAAATSPLTGIITLMDNGTYAATAPLVLQIPAGSRLLVVCAQWPDIPQDGGRTARVVGRITPTGVRAHLRGDIEVRSGAGSVLWCNGVLIEGALNLVAAGGEGLAALHVDHCTLVPAAGGLGVASGHENLTIALTRSICGRLRASGRMKRIRVVESALDAGTGLALDAPDVAVAITAATIIGRTEVQQLEAENSIFTRRVDVARRQNGCMRFSFVPFGSHTPRRHRCQPDLALVSAADPTAEAVTLARVVPDFTDEAFGAPAWLQLAATGPVEIAAGADDGAEMGVWWFLRQPQRQANLRASLDEYLRLGLEAGLIFAS